MSVCTRTRTYFCYKHVLPFVGYVIRLPACTISVSSPTDYQHVTVCYVCVCQQMLARVFESQTSNGYRKPSLSCLIYLHKTKGFYWKIIYNNKMIILNSVKNIYGTIRIMKSPICILYHAFCFSYKFTINVKLEFKSKPDIVTDGVSLSFVYTDPGQDNGNGCT